eukprot:ctg_366.g224
MRNGADGAAVSAHAAARPDPPRRQLPRPLRRRPRHSASRQNYPAGRRHRGSDTREWWSRMRHCTGHPHSAAVPHGPVAVDDRRRGAMRSVAPSALLPHFLRSPSPPRVARVALEISGRTQPRAAPRTAPLPSAPPSTAALETPGCCCVQAHRTRHPVAARPRAARRARSPAPTARTPAPTGHRRTLTVLWRDTDSWRLAGCRRSPALDHFASLASPATSVATRAPVALAVAPPATLLPSPPPSRPVPTYPTPDENASQSPDSSFMSPSSALRLHRRAPRRPPRRFRTFGPAHRLPLGCSHRLRASFPGVYMPTDAYHPDLILLLPSWMSLPPVY